MGFHFTAKPADWVTVTSPNQFNVFFVGEAQTLTLTGGPRAGSTYEVRNYYGTVVDSGSAAPSSITLPSLPLGWYRIYIYRASPIATWGTSQGVRAFCVWRDTAGMPPRPAIDSPDSMASFRDAPYIRSAALAGPGRMIIAAAVDPQAGGGHEHLGTPETDGAVVESATLNTIYKAYDTARAKKLFVAFTNGTAGATTGVQTCVNTLNPIVKYWEGRNEPDSQGVPVATHLTQAAEFYAAVKGADATAKVLGPSITTLAGVVTAGSLKYLTDYLDGGGGAFIDALSFHDYNGVNGDLALGRKTYARLGSLLTARGLAGIEKWVTEWGCWAAVAGAHQPRLQARWVMMEFMLLEQYGIPKEQFAYFYDHTSGFWAFPSEWITDADVANGCRGLYPSIALVRVWSEELLGKNFTQRYGFGSVEDRHYIGSRFVGADGASVAAFASAGRTDGVVNLNVAGATSLTVVSPWGAISTLAVVAGQAQLPVEIGIPTYVRLPVGVTLTPAYTAYGPDLARTATATASGGAADVSKVLNGDMSTWYFLQQGDGYTSADAPFFANGGVGHNTFPLWIEIAFGSSKTFDTVHVLCPPPWQTQGTLLDYDLQYWNGSSWVTIETITEPTQVMAFVSPTTDANCLVESYFSDRCTFVHTFAPITATKIRLYVRDSTYGGGPTVDVANAGGQTGYHDLCIREIEVYNRSALPAPKYVALGV